ncbi:hypothetical protein AB0L99_34160 [Streptomyces sp. NPDC051954]|uniref:hypothetical protein n=1 Tax=unclassified Streptomyces TaxID=2593676 RepID=UPI00343FF502
MSEPWAADLGEHADDPPVIVLYGPPGADRSVLARKTAQEHASAHRLSVHWLDLDNRSADPERVALRLCLAMGESRLRLTDGLLDMPSAHPGGDAVWACRERLRYESAVIVLDDLPVGPLGEGLLRMAARWVAGTDGLVLATSLAPPAQAVGGPRVLSRKVTAGVEEAADRAVVRRGLAQLEPEEADLFHALVAWEGAEFSADFAPRGELTRTEWRETLDRFLRHRFLHQPRAGWYAIRPSVRARPTRIHGRHWAEETSRLLDSALADSLLDVPGMLADAAEPYVDLALRLLRADDPNAPRFTVRLAHQLVLEDAGIPLLMLRAGLRETDSSPDALRIPFAMAARREGKLQEAAEVLTGIGTPEAVRELAVTEYHMGRLLQAEATLDTLPADVLDGWALHTRAAIRIDRGEPSDVGRLLRRAIETHQVRGDISGEAWAVFHYGRLRLMRGDMEEARKRLEAAWHMFRDVGDVVGTAWAHTELCRVDLLVRGPQPDVLRELQALPGAHEKHDDVRGAAWAWLLLGVAHADAHHDRRAARDALDRAARLFEDLPDLLGSAWTAHHRGTLSPGPGRSSRVPDEFTRAGCSNGEAWGLLETALRNRDAVKSRPLLDRAARLFEAIGDVAGVQWAAVGEDGTLPLQVLRRLADFYPRHVLAGVEGRTGLLMAPHTIRHLVPEPGVFTDRAQPEDLRPAAHVRLTLLDDSPAVGSAARVTLRIETDPEHPWTTPPLTARATPLTYAEVEPVHAVPVDSTTLFRFTPRIVGHHRIRFTIEDAETSTVLQQIETDIDVTRTLEGAPYLSSAPGRRA